MLDSMATEATQAWQGAERATARDQCHHRVGLLPGREGGAQHRYTVESPVTVSGLAGNAPAGLQVGVEIRHTYRGDLAIDLVAPDGSTYRLKDPDPFDAVENVAAVYSVDASAEPASGTWRLRVRDVSAQDGGYLDAWDLTF